MLVNFRNYWSRLPDIGFSHILLRIPLALAFIQAGVSKMPYDVSGGEAYGLPALVWWVVVYGEMAAGLGLLVGALTTVPKVSDIAFVAEIGDVITRFSGVVMCCIMTGIIWVVIKPDNLFAFLWDDYLHFSLWAGGLYFALRGNWAVAMRKKVQ